MKGRKKKIIVEEVESKEIPPIQPVQVTENKDWDIKIGDEIEYFDPTLSYEVTGYKPIDATHGLDFNPSWFTESRDTKTRTGKYCDYVIGSKAYSDFWDREYARCRDGMTVNGYTITGDNYFFLNFYQLPNLASAKKAGAGRNRDFPGFYVKQYEYFHYIELCKVLRKNAIGLKARGLGFSEIGASIALNTYSVRQHSRSVIAAQLETYVSDTLDKCWKGLDFLDDETQDGFRKLRQAHNTATWKRASSINTDRVEFGWMSEIVGITADRPNKIRGDRTDLLIYEESGSWPNWKKAFIQGDALVNIQGQKFGIKLAWGTGGDSGPALEGLSDAYYNPLTYDALPYRHNYTADNTYALTGYFIPAYTMITIPGYIDARGWTDPIKGRKFYQDKRDLKAGDPKGLILYSAEYCFTAEEALALEGENQFNTVMLSEQLAAIRLHKQTPEELKPKVGDLLFTFKDNKHIASAISGVRFIPNPRGKVTIIEHPIEGDKGKGYNNLYVAGIDGIDIGQEDTSSATKDPSDFCVVVKKRAFGVSDPMYVCVYKDRPQKIEDAYKITWAILEYYHCKAVIESTRISVLNWFRTRNMADKYFMRRPKALLTDANSRSRQFGAQATEVVIHHQLDLIDSYINDYCHDIWYEPIINELITYSYENKRKFDIVAALGMVELGDEELSGVSPRPIEDISNQFQEFGYWTDSYGVKHKGIIPKGQDVVPKFNLWPEQYDDSTRVRTSDTRYVH
jgi:hypothetical protein